MIVKIAIFLCDHARLGCGVVFNSMFILKLMPRRKSLDYATSRLVDLLITSITWQRQQRCDSFRVTIVKIGMKVENIIFCLLGWRWPGR